MTPRPPLSDILNATARFIESYVFCSQEQSDTLALWTLHTHCVGAFYCTPYVHVSSAEPASGKTRLLEALEALTHDPWMAADITPSAMYRIIDETAQPPTLLIDETDAVFRNGKGEASDRAEALRAIINSGYKRGGRAIRCDGPQHHPVKFSTYCPKALAGLKPLPDTIRDRSIPIRLLKKRPGESVADWDGQHVEETQAPPMRAAIVGWATSAEADLRKSRPAAPPGLSDRQREIWRPLLAIADLAGGTWPERARTAARVLCHVDTDEATTGVRLLADIRMVLTGGALVTARLIEELGTIEEAPWGDYYGKPITPQKLGALLRPYGVRTRHWRDGSKTIRGYHREDFEDAWSRHLPLRTGTTGTTRMVEPKTPVREPAQTPHSVPVLNGEKPHNQAVVPVVPVPIPVPGAEAPGEALTLDEVLTRNGAAEGLAAHDLEDVTPPAVPYGELSAAQRAEQGRLLAKHHDLADGGGQ
jgi:hypothetical protein